MASPTVRSEAFVTSTHLAVACEVMFIKAKSLVLEVKHRSREVLQFRSHTCLYVLPCVFSEMSCKCGRDWELTEQWLASYSTCSNAEGWIWGSTV